MTISYPRYELSVLIVKRLDWNESKLIVQTTTGIPDTVDIDTVRNTAVELVDFALFEGWDEVLNEEPR